MFMLDMRKWTWFKNRITVNPLKIEPRYAHSSCKFEKGFVIFGGAKSFNESIKLR